MVAAGGDSSSTVDVTFCDGEHEQTVTPMLLVASMQHGQRYVHTDDVVVMPVHPVMQATHRQLLFLLILLLPQAACMAVELCYAHGLHLSKGSFLPRTCSGYIMLPGSCCLQHLQARSMVGVNIAAPSLRHLRHHTTVL